MGKHFIRLLIIGAVLGIGYFLSTRENASSYTIPFIEITRKKVSDSADKILPAVRKYGEDLPDSFSDKSGEIFNKIFDGAKKETFNFFQQTVNEKVDSLGMNLLGIGVREIGREIAAPSKSPVVFGIQAGNPAYFSIKNSESESIKYEADWLDGDKKIGQVAAGKSETVSHKWNSTGEYRPKFKITTPKGEKIYEVAISVISL